VSLHALLDSDFYREGARVTPAPRRRSSAVLAASSHRCRGSSGHARRRRRLAVIQREWQRIDPKYLDDDEQRFWATIAGRQIRFDQRAEFAKKFAEGRAGKGALEQFLSTCAAENPNRRLRMTALMDRVATPVDRADFDDLVTLVTQAPPWEKDRAAGVRILLRAIGEGKPVAPEQILARWTWRLARATRKVQDRRVSTEFPEAKRLLGAARTHVGTGTRRTSTASCRSRARCRCRSVPHSSPRRRLHASRELGRSITRARSSGRSPRSRSALADNLPLPS
jgi:hypothetical protein